LIRAAQEGIAFSFRYGLDVMKEIGLKINAVKAGYSNLFKSEIFREAFVNTCNISLDIYNTDGSQGAARGAGIGSGFYSSGGEVLNFRNREVFKGLSLIEKLEPQENKVQKYNLSFEKWKSKLEKWLL
jgi:xylulokinase